MITLCGEVASHRKRLVGSVVSAISRSTVIINSPLSVSTNRQCQQKSCMSMRCMACKEDWSFVSPSCSWTKWGTLPRTKGVKIVIKDIFFVYSYLGVLRRIPKFLPFTHTVFYGLASTSLALPIYDGEFISTYLQRTPHQRQSALFSGTSPWRRSSAAITFEFPLHRSREPALPTCFNDRLCYQPAIGRRVQDFPGTTSITCCCTIAHTYSVNIGVVSGCICILARLKGWLARKDRRDSHRRSCG